MQYSTCTLQSHITASGAGGSGARVLAAGDWAADGGAGGGADEQKIYFFGWIFQLFMLLRIIPVSMTHLSI